MTDRAALLDYAEQLLDGTVTLGARGPRTAALLARRAFEDWLDESCATWSPAVGPRPSTASKLVVLQAFRGEVVGGKAKRVWHQLSVACHHHAYELQPSASEVRHLVGAVRALDGG